MAWKGFRLQMPSVALNRSGSSFTKIKRRFVTVHYGKVSLEFHLTNANICTIHKMQSPGTKRWKYLVCDLYGTGKCLTCTFSFHCQCCVYCECCIYCSFFCNSHLPVYILQLLCSPIAASTWRCRYFFPTKMLM